MQPDPLHIQQVTGTNVVIGPGAQQTIILDGQPILLPGFDDMTAHLAAVAAHPGFARWANRPEGDPPLSQQPSLDAGPPRVWPDLYLEERAAPANVDATLPQRLAAWRPAAAASPAASQDLLEALAGVKRAVILGEPGSGKTTALERLAWVIAARSLAAAGDGILHLPIFIPLRDYRGEADLIPSLRRALHQHGVLELNDLSLRLLLRARNLRFTLLLDGLNELGRYAEEGTAALACHLRDYPQHSVYLTCRIADFDPDNQTPPGAQVWQVQELQDEIRYWGDGQGHSDVRAYLRRHLGEEAGKRLYERLRADERLRQAARLPLLLWMIKEAGGGGALPGDRGGLVRAFVRSPRLLGRVPKDLRDEAERSLEAIGWALQAQRALETGEEVLMAALAGVRGRREYSLEDMRRHLQGSGLLIDLGEERYRLLHQLIQEYAAAGRLVRQAGSERLLLELAADEWQREVCILALWLHEGLHTADYLQGVMGRPEVDLRVRVAAAGILAQVGDPRFVPTLIRGVKVILPDLVRIPGGRAALGGEDPDGDDDELPECEVEIAAFDLACYPVTNAEYACFMKAGGYEDKSLWTAGGRAWLKGEGKLDAETEEIYRNQHRRIRENVEAVLSGWKRQGQDISDEEADTWRTLATWGEDEFVTLYAQDLLGEQRRQPVWWDDARYSQATQPVVGVNWYEAMAHAAWLGRVTGEPYALPTEAQWEWAARRRSPAEPGRRYPWGDDWDASRCNHAGSRLLAPSPMGVYPHGVTPDGLHDLAGNVYEWTASLFRPYPYDPADGREDAEADGIRSIRGGSWYVGSVQVRCAFRDWTSPGSRTDSLGFRVARSLSG